jgi:hypothetical protein
MACRRIEAMSSDEEEGGANTEGKGSQGAVMMEQDDASISSSCTGSCNSSSSSDTDAGEGAEACESDRVNDLADSDVHEEEALALVTGALDSLASPMPSGKESRKPGGGHPPTHPSYDAYTACVETLRGVAHSLAGKPAGLEVLEKLRSTRDAFAATYLLPADAWSEWARDEATLPGGGGVKAARRLLEEKALVDMPGSVTLRLVHLALVEDDEGQKEEGAEDGGNGGEGCSNRRKATEEAVRRACEAAVAAAGMHVLEGHKVWEAYRTFEMGVLRRARDAQWAMEGESLEGGRGGRSKEDGGEERKAEARERVVRLLERQAAVPLLEGCRVLEAEWEAFVGAERAEMDRWKRERKKGGWQGEEGGRGGDSEEGGAVGVVDEVEALAAAGKRLKILLAASKRRLERILMPVERALSAHGRKKHERVGLWEAYIGVEMEREEGEEGGGEVARSRARHVLERAVTDCYFAPSLWEIYIDLVSLPSPYASARPPSPLPPPSAAALAVVKRAFKCTPGAVGLWLRYLRILEETAAGPEALDAAAQEALEGPLRGQAEEGLALLQAHIDAARRRVWAAVRAGEDGEGQPEPERRSRALAGFEAAVGYAEAWTEAFHPEWDAARLALLRARLGLLTDLGELTTAWTLWWGPSGLGKGSRLRVYWQTWSEGAVWARAHRGVGAALEMLREAARAVQDSPTATWEAWAEVAREGGCLKEYEEAMGWVVRGRWKAAAKAGREGGWGEEGGGGRAKPGKDAGAGHQLGHSAPPPGFGEGGNARVGGNGRRQTGNASLGRCPPQRRGQVGATGGNGGTARTEGRGGRDEGVDRKWVRDTPEEPPLKRARAKETSSEQTAGSSSLSAVWRAPEDGAEAKGELDDAVYRRTIFVKKLDKNVLGPTLRAAMDGIVGEGAVEDLQLLTSKSGRPRGMAIVTLRSTALYEAAVKEGRLEGVGVEKTEGIARILPFNIKFITGGISPKANDQEDGEETGGRAAHCEKGLPQGKVQEEEKKTFHPTTIFLTGLLNWNGGIADLRALFEEHVPESKVQAVNIAMDKCTGKRKGTALVQFTEPGPVASALKLRNIGKLLNLHEVVKVRQSRFPVQVEGPNFPDKRDDPREERNPSRARVFFAPRVLQRKQGRLSIGQEVGHKEKSKEAQQTPSEKFQTSGTYTQEDFKKMIMKS